MGIWGSTAVGEPNRTKEWTPGWYPGFLCRTLHYTDRGFPSTKYNNSFNVSSLSHPYVQGVTHVGMIELWWMMIALLILFTAEFRRYFVIPFGTAHRAQRFSIFVMACALIAVLVLEAFFHISVVSTMPAITIHPADNGEITLYMKRIEAQMNSITSAVMERYYGSAVRMSNEPVYVHKVLENILRATDEIILTYRDPRQARAIHTPLKVFMLSVEWIHFLAFMSYWATSLLVIALFSITRCYFAASAMAVIFCGLGACLQLMFSILIADSCFDPRYMLYTLQPSYQFYRTEEEAIQTEYYRVCTEWYAKFEILIEHYEKNFMYAAYELHSRALACAIDDDWRYLDETADKIYNVSRDDVSELRNILPPRCRPEFPDVTYPVRPTWTTPPLPPYVTQPSTTTLTLPPSYPYTYWNPFREAVTAPPYYTHPLQDPRFLPPYDVVLRALCIGDRKLMLILMQIGLLMLALTSVILIMLYAFLTMRPPNYLSCHRPCNKSHNITCLTRYCKQVRRKHEKKRKSNKYKSRNEKGKSKKHASCCHSRSKFFPWRSSKCSLSSFDAAQAAGLICCNRPKSRFNLSNLSLALRVSSILNHAYSTTCVPKPQKPRRKVCRRKVHKRNRLFKMKRTSCTGSCQTAPMQCLSSVQTFCPGKVDSPSQTGSCMSSNYSRANVARRYRPRVSYADDVYNSACSGCKKPLRRRRYVAETRLVECISSHQADKGKLPSNHKMNGTVSEPSSPRLGIEEFLDNIEEGPVRKRRIREIYLKFH